MQERPLYSSYRDFQAKSAILQNRFSGLVAKQLYEAIDRAEAAQELNHWGGITDGEVEEFERQGFEFFKEFIPGDRHEICRIFASSLRVGVKCSMKILHWELQSMNRSFRFSFLFKIRNWLVQTFLKKFLHIWANCNFHRVRENRQIPVSKWDWRVEYVHHDNQDEWEERLDEVVGAYARMTVERCRQLRQDNDFNPRLLQTELGTMTERGISVWKAVFKADEAEGNGYRVSIPRVINCMYMMCLDMAMNTPSCLPEAPAMSIDRIEFYRDQVTKEFMLGPYVERPYFPLFKGNFRRWIRDTHFFWFRLAMSRRLPPGTEVYERIWHFYCPQEYF